MGIIRIRRTAGPKKWGIAVGPWFFGIVRLEDRAALSHPIPTTQTEEVGNGL